MIEPKHEQQIAALATAHPADIVTPGYPFDFHVATAKKLLELDERMTAIEAEER